MIRPFQANSSLWLIQLRLLLRNFRPHHALAIEIENMFWESEADSKRDSGALCAFEPVNASRKIEVRD